MADEPILLQDPVGAATPEVTLGMRIFNLGDTLPLDKYQVALNDPGGPQDLCVECCDNAWALESSSSTRHYNRLCYWKDCARQFTYTRPTTDTLFPVSGSGPGFTKPLYYGCDCAGNFYFVSFASGEATIRIRRCTITNTQNEATINFASGGVWPSLPLPHPSGYAFSSAVITGWFVQDVGILVVCTVTYTKASNPNITVPAVAAIAPDLTYTAALVDPTVLPTSVFAYFPMNDGILAQLNLAGVASTAEIASDGSIVNSAAQIPFFSAIQNNLPAVGLVQDFWLTREETSTDVFERFLYCKTDNANPSDPLYYLRRWNLTTFVEDTKAWYPDASEEDFRFVVSPNGHRLTITLELTAVYRVYENPAGTLLIDEPAIVDFETGAEWPVETWRSPAAADRHSAQHTADNRVAFHSMIYLDISRDNLYKLTLDSILWFRRVATVTVDNPDVPFRWWVRGQYGHMTYPAWE